MCKGPHTAAPSLFLLNTFRPLLLGRWGNSLCRRRFAVKILKKNRVTRRYAIKAAELESNETHSRLQSHISDVTSDKEQHSDTTGALLEFVNALINTCTLSHRREVFPLSCKWISTWPCIAFLRTCEPSNTKTHINLAFCTVVLRFYINLSFVLFKRKKVEQPSSLDRQRQAGASRGFVICAPHSKALTVAYASSSDEFKCHV